MSQEDPKNTPAPSDEEKQDEKIITAVKKSTIFFGKSMTVNHITRLFNRGSRRAYSVGESMVSDLEQQKAKSEFCCPYCSQTYLTQEKDSSIWLCESCGAEYEAGKHKKDVYRFFSEHGRAIYLKGKGVPNTAYTRHGFDHDTEINTMAQINALYIGSKFVFVLAVFAFIQAIRTPSAMVATVALLMGISTLLYSMYYGYRAYCLATRQMYVYGRWHFLYWLKSVGLLYMFHVGKRAGYQYVVEEFERKESAGDFDRFTKKHQDLNNQPSEMMNENDENH